MSEPSFEIPPPERPTELRLDSWKEIAVYLKRDITTVQRWEKREGMPIHRHEHDKRSSVYALTPELNAWLRERRPSAAKDDNQAEIQTPTIVAAHQGWRGALRAHRWLTLALAAAASMSLLAGAYFAHRNRIGNAARPMIKSLAVLPLKNLSGDPTQEYLADGMTEDLIGRLSRI